MPTGGGDELDVRVCSTLVANGNEERRKTEVRQMIDDRAAYHLLDQLTGCFERLSRSVLGSGLFCQAKITRMSRVSIFTATPRDVTSGEIGTVAKIVAANSRPMIDPVLIAFLLMLMTSA